MSLNLTESVLNKTYISISLTPELFLKVFESIYRNDEDIIVVRKWAFILSILFMLIGIIGNILNVITFSSKEMRKHKFNLYFLVSTVFKLIFCLTLLFDYLFSKIYLKSIFLHNFHSASRIIIDFIIHTSDSSVSLLILFLSLDRLYAIRNPLKIKEFITNLHAKPLTIISLLIVILLKIISIIFCCITVNSTMVLIICVIITPVIFILNILLLKKVVCYNFREGQNSIEFLGRVSITFFNFEIDRVDRANRVDSNRNESLELNEFNIPLRNKSINLFEDRLESKRLDSNESKKRERSRTLLRSSRSSLPKKLTLLKKSHYIVIIISDIFSILTTTPYYLLNYYFMLFQLNIFNIETLIFLQITSSVLFNSNHCLNFFFYFSFYDDFRAVFKNFFLKQMCKNRSSTPISL